MEKYLTCDLCGHTVTIRTEMARVKGEQDPVSVYTDTLWIDDMRAHCLTHGGIARPDGSVWPSPVEWQSG
ncbi:hypothetical protein ACL1CN_13880 [Corynebacterium striatum]|uniref:hypothetical protein n=1 Tax=Corynebacterium striatum TaxID=43770 RepID=UPI00141A50DD|nr:hypothetical protein [Corynebacterium striatum]NHX52972.1 hypothetical protein [Corynebacterium striatum]NHY37584.1 hypothetical protein [Corynebacterium striatum]HAT1133929.1 hypothetical protein [Corynebacterium striatum]HAT1156512.1 hypothetical protein [Corynebacterium striatum]HAT1161972.1 hypothetical protein [Corynebacterium striatum]